MDFSKVPLIGDDPSYLPEKYTPKGKLDFSSVPLTERALTSRREVISEIKPERPSMWSLMGRELAKRPPLTRKWWQEAIPPREEVYPITPAPPPVERPSMLRLYGRELKEQFFPEMTAKERIKSSVGAMLPLPITRMLPTEYQTPLQREALKAERMYEQAILAPLAEMQKPSEEREFMPAMKKVFKGKSDVTGYDIADNIEKAVEGITKGTKIGTLMELEKKVTPKFMQEFRKRMIGAGYEYIASPWFWLLLHGAAREAAERGVSKVLVNKTYVAAKAKGIVTNPKEYELILNRAAKGESLPDILKYYIKAKRLPNIENIIRNTRVAQWKLPELTKELVPVTKGLPAKIAPAIAPKVIPAIKPKVELPAKPVPEGKEIFKLETGLSLDALLGKKPYEGSGGYKTLAEYFAKVKGQVGNIVEMTPDEYLSKIPYMPKSSESIAFMKKKLMKGEKLSLPFLDYSGSGRVSQEGRNRAHLAKMLGIKKIPVLVVTKPTPPVKEVVTPTKPKVEVKPEIETFKPREMPKERIVPEVTERELIKKSRIIKDLSEKLDVPIRRGLFRGKALGIYKKKPDIIRLKVGAVQTVSHEVGHYLQDNITDLSSLKLRQFNKELLPLTKDFPLAQQKPSEGFAEAIRLYITDPAQLKQKAPEFNTYFDKFMDKMPEVRDILVKARTDYKRWLEMPSTAKVFSQISLKPETLREPVLDNLTTALIDDLNPIANYVRLAEKKGVQLRADEDPYILARNFRGWIGKANVMLNKETFEAKTPFKKIGKGLKQILQPVEQKGTTDDLRIYLVSQHVIEVEAQGKKTGISVEDAKSAIIELEKKHPDFKAKAKELYEWQNTILRYGRDSGLYDDKTYQLLQKLYPRYVPFYRVMEEAGKRGLLGKRFANVFSPIKRLKGSEREIIEPLESMIKNAYAIINASDRNAISKAIVRLSELDKDLGRLVEKIPTPMTKVASVNLKDLGIDLPEGVEPIQEIFRPSYMQPGKNVISVLREGKREFYQVEPSLYKAVMGLETEDVGMLLKFLAKPASWLRAGATLTPEFMFRNPARDQLTAFIYSKYGYKPIFDLAKGIWGLVKKDEDFILWQKAGGAHSMLVSMDRDYMQKNLRELVRTKGQQLKNVLKNPIEFARVISELGEAGTRLGEFKRGMRLGAEPVEVAYSSREVTLDFSRKGAKTRAINMIRAFWNANVQGTNRMVREFKNHPGRMSFKVLLGITLPSVILYMVNRKDKRYQELPQWQKDLFWIILTEDHIWRIPKPFEVGILFGSVPERLLQYMDRKDPESLNKVARTLIEGASPGYMPTGLQPLVESITNYDFFRDRKIVPESEKNLEPELQYGSYTTETAKIIGKLIKYPPRLVENWIRGYFGGLGQHALDITDFVLKKIHIVDTPTEVAKELEDMPAIRAFLARKPIGSQSESVNKFYDNYGRRLKFDTTYREYVKLGKIKEKEEYRKKHPEFTKQGLRKYRKVAKFFGGLRAKQEEIRKSNLTPLQKKTQIQALDELMTEVAQGILAKK